MPFDGQNRRRQAIWRTKMTGNDLKNWRMRMGMTQNDLALRIGVSAQTISNYERRYVVPRVVSLAVKYMLTTRAS